jgi:hypothetical protein
MIYVLFNLRKPPSGFLRFRSEQHLRKIEGIFLRFIEKYNPKNHHPGFCVNLFANAISLAGIGNNKTVGNLAKKFCAPIVADTL